MTLTATIGGTAVTVLLPFQRARRTNLRTTAQFTVLDETGTSLALEENMAVSITDSVLGTVFVGYVEHYEVEKAGPGAAATFKTISCKNNRWLADKRYYTGEDYHTARLAGDIATDLVARTLSQEGVIANYAQRYDHDAATWGAGTLTGTTGTAEGLITSKAGTDLTISESTQAEWADNEAMYGLTATAAGLTLEAAYALKFVGQCSPVYTTNAYNYRVIWSGAYTIVDGDYLNYDTFMSSTSPDFKGIVDLGFSDGTYLRDKSFLDEWGVSCAANTDRSRFCSDLWNGRTILLTEGSGSLVGQTISTVLVALEGDKAGAYAYYFKRIQVCSTGGTVRIEPLNPSTGALAKNSQVSNIGFYNTVLSVVTAYTDYGARYSPHYSISSPGLAGASFLSWLAEAATQMSVSSVAGKRAQITVEVSLDGGATFQTCENHHALPSALVKGMDLAGKTLQYRQTLCLGGPNPEVTPVLKRTAATIAASYAATKTDAGAAWSGDAGWNMGTYSNTFTAFGWLRITGYYQSWDNGGLQDAVLYSADGTAQLGNDAGVLFTTCNTANDAHISLSDSTDTYNFVLECDLQVPTAGASAGVLFHTTYWATENNTFGYCVYLDTAGIHMAKGTNTSPGVWTTLYDKAITLTAGDWHRVMVNATGNVYNAYLNGVSMFAVTDTSFPHGTFGFRLWNGSGSRTTARYNAFGAQNYTLTGSWTAPSLALNAVGTVGASHVNWMSYEGDGATIKVEASLNGGSTWQTCTNGGEVPQLPKGTSVTGTSLLLRATISAQAYNRTAALLGLAVCVVGEAGATGTRTAPALSLAPVGILGSSSVYWSATTPTNTAVAVYTSIDGGANWDEIAAPGDPITGVTGTPDPTVDDFLTNTAASYTTSGTWTWDTANSRLVGTATGNCVRTTPTYVDGAVATIIDYAQEAGLVGRWADDSNYYYVIIEDASSLAAPSTMRLYKRVAGTPTPLTEASAIPTFTRGVKHAFRLSIVGTSITAECDGIQYVSATDSSLAAAGKWGVHIGTTRMQATTLWLSPQGQDVSALAVLSRSWLLSNDPQVSPVLHTLTVSAHATEIDSGAVIPSTQATYKQTIGAMLDDLASRSNGWWMINDDKHLVFQTRLARLAAWPIDSAHADDLLASTAPRLSYASEAYRNRQYITGGVQVLAQTEQKQGDGIAQSWPLGYKIAAGTVPTVTIGNAVQTVAMKDSGLTAQIYYAEGEAQIVQDTAEIPPGADVLIAISYEGTAPYTAMAESTTQQTLLAGYDGSSGIVENVEEAPAEMTAATMDQLAEARIDQYALLTRTWSFTTRRDGLAPGTILYCYVPELNLNDAPMLITEVKETIAEELLAGVKATYDVTCTEGPSLQGWQAFFSRPH